MPKLFTYRSFLFLLFFRSFGLSKKFRDQLAINWEAIYC